MSEQLMKCAVGKLWNLNYVHDPLRYQNTLKSTDLQMDKSGMEAVDMFGKNC